jgi:hypothetical protein
MKCRSEAGEKFPGGQRNQENEWFPLERGKDQEVIHG